MVVRQTSATYILGWNCDFNQINLQDKGKEKSTVQLVGRLGGCCWTFSITAANRKPSE